MQGASQPTPHEPVFIRKVQSSAEFDQTKVEDQMNTMSLLMLEDRSPYYSMMTDRVGSVLFIGDLYDFSQVDSCFTNAGFSTCPRFYYSTFDNLHAYLETKSRYDLIFAMFEKNDQFAFETLRTIRKIHKFTPIFPLIQSVEPNGTICIPEEKIRFWMWNGDPMLFVALIKLIEDKKNLKYDVLNQSCGIILFIEDTIQYYSEYITHLYTELFKRTMNAVGLTAKHLIARRHARPKVVFAPCFEDALACFHQYGLSIIGVITDIEYPLTDSRTGPHHPALLELMQSKDGHSPVLSPQMFPHSAGIK